MHVFPAQRAEDDGGAWALLYQGSRGRVAFQVASVGEMPALFDALVLVDPFIISPQH